MSRKVLDIQPWELQPLNMYTVYANDDNELMIALPGYYKGEPTIKELHYCGGAHAILMRSDHQYILCDYLDEGVRPFMKVAEQVLIYETDIKREYMVKVVHTDVEKLAKKCLSLHDYSIPFHPYPIATGAFDIGKEKCNCCGRATMLSYTGPIYPRVDSVTLCPKCIASGKAAKKYNGTFVFPVGPTLGMDYEYINSKTVPYHAKEFLSVLWTSHCGGVCTYLGRIEPEDITEELWEEALENWDHMANLHPLSRAEEIRERVNKAELAAHLFLCAKCKKHLLYFTEE